MSKNDKKYSLLMGLFFIVGGIISEVSAARKMLHFFETQAGIPRMSMDEMVLGLVLPHMIMLVALGVIVYGVGLTTKGISDLLIRKRNK